MEQPMENREATYKGIVHATKVADKWAPKLREDSKNWPECMVPEMESQKARLYMFKELIMKMKTEDERESKYEQLTRDTLEPIFIEEGNKSLNYF